MPTTELIDWNSDEVMRVTTAACREMTRYPRKMRVSIAIGVLVNAIFEGEDQEFLRAVLNEPVVHVGGTVHESIISMLRRAAR